MSEHLKRAMVCWWFLSHPSKRRWTSGEWKGQQRVAGKMLVFLFDLMICLTGEVLMWPYLPESCF